MEENNFVQEIIKLPYYSDSYHREDYIIGESNQKAFSAILQEHLGFSPYPNILLIKGSRFCGKTFLAHICAKERNGILILKAENLTKLTAGVYIIDDADKWEEEELFHAINLANENKQQLLLFSALFWKPKLKDLASRVQALKTEKIEELDDQLMEIIIVQEFSKKSLIIGREIVTYLARRLPRNFLEVRSSIEQIDDFCLKNKRNITIKAITEYLQQ